MKPAPILIRILAYCTDNLLFLLLVVLSKFFIPGAMYALDQTIPNISEQVHSLLKQTATVFFVYSDSGYLFSFISLLYFVYFEQSEWQGTLGKKLFKIKVVDSKNKRLSLLKALTRYLIFAIAPGLLLRLVLFFTNPACLNMTNPSTTCTRLFVAYSIVYALLWLGPIFFTKDNSTTYDILSNTKVVG
jgi:uncharacterized RDD family membrane protein YckC